MHAGSGFLLSFTACPAANGDVLYTGHALIIFAAQEQWVPTLDFLMLVSSFGSVQFRFAIFLLFLHCTHIAVVADDL